MWRDCSVILDSNPDYVGAAPLLTTMMRRCTDSDFVLVEASSLLQAEVREQIRLTVIHELGHYFGMDENQLKDV